MAEERGKGSLFPEGWCVPEMLGRVIEWIRWLDIQAEGKKQILLLWCDCAGVPLTHELVKRVLEE